MSRRVWAGLPAGWEVRGTDYLMVADAHGPLASVSARGDVRLQRSCQALTYEDLQALFAIATQHGSRCRESERPIRRAS